MHDVAKLADASTALACAGTPKAAPAHGCRKLSRLVCKLWLIAASPHAGIVMSWKQPKPEESSALSMKASSMRSLSVLASASM